MAKAEKVSPGPKATFVFEGTVKKLKAALMKSVTVDAHTAVVHVDQVLEAPANLRHLAGTDITVQLVERVKTALGESFVFHGGGADRCKTRGRPSRAADVDDRRARPRKRG